MWVCQWTRIVIISKDEHMHKRQFFLLLWTLSSSLINCLCGELFILSTGGGLCFDVQWKVFRKFCLLCYKQVIALSPRRIKDKFSLVFSKFSQITVVATRLGQFCENFENTRENLSLILLGLMRLHIQKQTRSNSRVFGSYHMTQLNGKLSSTRDALMQRNFRVFRWSGKVGRPREVHPKFPHVFPENFGSIRFFSRKLRKFCSNEN